MQGDDLDPHQVVARGDALGDIKVVPASVGDEGVDCPDTVVEARVGNLEPFVACGSGGGGVVYFCEVDGDWALKKREGLVSLEL